jgi:CheY-like chemotaxis protein
MKRILLVEDNPGDVRLMQEAFKEIPALVELTVCEDGASAMQLLKQFEHDTKRPLPQLVILDLNIPKIHGLEILQHIKNNRRLSSLPVVVLTTSVSGSDIAQAYSLHCNAYITKPLDITHFFDIVRTIYTFWLDVVILPKFEE